MTAFCPASLWKAARMKNFAHDSMNMKQKFISISATFGTCRNQSLRSEGTFGKDICGMALQMYVTLLWSQCAFGRILVKTLKFSTSLEIPPSWPILNCGFTTIKSLKQIRFVISSPPMFIHRHSTTSLTSAGKKEIRHLRRRSWSSQSKPRMWKGPTFGIW